MEDLSRRERSILDRLITCYIDTGEPIGSRTLSKTGLELSAATVRNSMADLEERGYLHQPHTSAGRIPTDKGYRVHVDALMEQEEITDEERVQLREMVEAAIRESKVDILMEQVSKVIADVSQNLGVALSPGFESGRFRSIEMVKLSESKLLIVITIRSGLVKTMMMEVDSRIERSDLEETRRILNERLSNLTMGEIVVGVEERLRDASGGAPKLLRLICDSAETLFEFTADEDLHLVGTCNFFLQPEFSEDKTRLAKLYELFEERSQMRAILNNRMGRDGIAITIGEENESPHLSGCSLLTSNYQLGNVTGVIGLMGPTRMAYAKMVPLVRVMAALTQDLLEERFEER